MKVLTVAVLLLGAGMLIRAQSTHGGSLAGKLTDINSAPLAGATVVLRNQATGAAVRATTARDGGFRFTGLETGRYRLEADSAQLGHGRLDDITVSAGHEARVVAAMQFALASKAPIHSVLLEKPSLMLPATAAPVSTMSASLPSALPSKPLRQLSLGILSVSILVPESPLPQTQTLPVILRLRPVEPMVTAALPTITLPKHEANQIAAVNAGLTASLSAATGLRAAMHWKLPRANSTRAEFERDDPVSSAVTSKLSATELQSLPATGRRWEEFVMDTPTAAAAPGSSQVSLRGAGPQGADASIDGASTQLAFGAAAGSSPGSQEQSSPGEGRSEPQGMGQPWSGGRFSVSEAAVHSVRTVAGNVEAGGAHAAGGRINVETQHGSNGLHGQGFIFDRQNNWGARNPFTQWVTETAPGTSTAVPVFTPQPFTPPDHEITWGIGAGSDIRRNKLFWFAALDSLRRNDPGLGMVKHPYLSPAVCKTPPCSPIGFFAQPSNDQMQLLGAQLGTSTNLALANYSEVLETLDGLLGPAPRTATQWTGFGRIDWKASERQNFTLEGIGALWNSPGGGLTGLSGNYGNHSFGSTKASKEWLLGRWEAFLTPNLLAVTQASAGRDILTARPDTPSAFEQTFLDGNSWGQLPQIVVDNRYGFTIGNPSRFGQGSYPDERLYHGEEMVDWVRNGLLVKAGFELDHNSDATSLLSPVGLAVTPPRCIRRCHAR